MSVTQIMDKDDHRLNINEDGTISVTLTGSLTNVTPTAVTTGVASGLALAANASRKYASFQNDSDTTIYLIFGVGPAVLNIGIRLNANGGTYEMSPAMGNLDLRDAYSISSGASKNLLVREGI